MSEEATSELCKQCQCSLEGIESTKVAEWSFCASCFAELMDGTAKKRAAEEAHAAEQMRLAEEAAERANAEPEREKNTEPELEEDPEGLDHKGMAMRFSVGPAALRCQTCKKEMRKEDSRAMAGTQVCATCYEVLADGFSQLSRDTVDEPSPAPEPKVAQVKVDLIAQATCAGCEKWIRKIAAKVRGEQMYCPDCFETLPKEPVEPEGIASCQACGQIVAELNLVDGFSLCSPCLSTDRELAIKLARERHLALMKQGV